MVDVPDTLRLVHGVPERLDAAHKPCLCCGLPMYGIGPEEMFQLMTDVLDGVDIW